MARDVSRAQKALAVGRWQRFVRSVKRIMTAVSLCHGGAFGFATKLATDMPLRRLRLRARCAMSIDVILRVSSHLK